MFKLVDITFHANTEYTDTTSLIKAQRTSLIYIDHFKKKAQVTVIKHFTNAGILIHADAGFRFFKAKNRFGYISIQTIHYLRKEKAAIIMVRGLIFPLQVICLRCLLGTKVKIMARHHADRPFTGLKRWLQVMADKCIDAYLFTSAGNADEWFEKGVIKNRLKIYELPATLTEFSKLDKTQSRKKLNMAEGLHYLWVGRLNSNKDPFTVLRAFELFVEDYEKATLHLIYQTEDLLVAIQERIAVSIALKKSVILEGYIPYEELAVWYSAADFYLSASYSEGGSSAILEAMACGCIPVLSNIPASMKVISNGRFGLCFGPGNANELYQQLVASTFLPYADYTDKAEKHYRTHYAPEAVAEQLIAVCEKLLTE